MVIEEDGEEEAPRADDGPAEESEPAEEPEADEEDSRDAGGDALEEGPEEAGGNAVDGSSHALEETGEKPRAIDESEVPRNVRASAEEEPRATDAPRRRRPRMPGPIPTRPRSSRPSSRRHTPRRRRRP